MVQLLLRPPEGASTQQTSPRALREPEPVCLTAGILLRIQNLPSFRRCLRGYYILPWEGRPRPANSGPGRVPRWATASIHTGRGSHQLQGQVGAGLGLGARFLFSGSSLSPVCNPPWPARDSLASEIPLAQVGQMPLNKGRPHPARE